MKTIVPGVLLALFLSVSHAHAQSEGDIRGEPMETCAAIIGKWHNSYDVTINLTILDAACNFKFAARRVLTERASGKGYFYLGTLVLPFTRFGGGESDRAMLRLRGDILGGTLVYSSFKFPIDLQKRTVFLEDF